MDHEPVPSVGERILAGAVEVAADHGISRLSMGDVAKRAGLSRQTLYNHFPSKEALVAAAIRGEAQRLSEFVVDSVAGITDPRAGLEAGLFAALVAMRQHPLLDRLVRTEPESLLPMLVDEQGVVHGVVRDAVDTIIARYLGAAVATDPQVALVGDVIARVLVSYAVRAPEAPETEIAATLVACVFDGVVAAPALTL